MGKMAFFLFLSDAATKFQSFYGGKYPGCMYILYKNIHIQYKIIIGLYALVPQILLLLSPNSQNWLQKNSPQTFIYIFSLKKA